MNQCICTSSFSQKTEGLLMFNFWLKIPARTYMGQNLIRQPAILVNVTCYLRTLHLSVPGELFHPGQHCLRL